MWQAIYEDLKGEGVEILAVALDTAGKDAVEAKIRAADISERPEIFGKLMNWPEELWKRQAPPTYTCLIDEEHVLAELYGMVNVPEAVWIDEEGRIVRPAESAGQIDMVAHLNRETFEIPDEIAQTGFESRMAYIDALHDWAKNGADSQYALSADEVQRRLRAPDDADVMASTHAKLGRHLFHAGELDAAKAQLQAASDLCPDKWSYRRQAMMLDPENIGELNAGPEFWAEVDKLDGKPYYEPAQLTA